MYIINRIKNSNGKVVRYTVNNDGRIEILDSNFVIANAHLVTNAYLVDGVYFRAKHGSHIDTIVEHNTALVKREPVSKVSSFIEFVPDYYGKEFISICRYIRQIAYENKFRLDTKPHKSNRGRNIQLFALIEACGISPREFVRNYLYHIQPYSLSRFMGTKTRGDDHIWLCDLGYNINLVIKIVKNESCPLVLSFHESNIKGKYITSGTAFDNKLCAVLVEGINSVVNNGQLTNVAFVVQRGFITYRIDAVTEYLRNGVALVKHSVIADNFMSTLNTIVEGLQSQYFTQETGSRLISGMSMPMHNVSFMSFGFATVNNISLLIDMYAYFTNQLTRAYLVDVAINLLSEVSSSTSKSILGVLKERYGGSNNGLYLALKGV